MSSSEENVDENQEIENNEEIGEIEEVEQVEEVEESSPKDNHIYLMRNANIYCIQGLYMIKPEHFLDFKKRYNQIIDSLGKFSIEKILSKSPLTNQYDIGFAHLVKLARETRVPDNEEDYGIVGRLTLDQDIEQVFRMLNLSYPHSSRSMGKLFGMIYTADVHVRDETKAILNENGAIQVGKEYCYSDLEERKLSGSTYFVANSCLTFSCVSPWRYSDTYTQQWVARTNNLFTFTWFKKQFYCKGIYELPGFKKRSFTISARHLDDLKLIGQCFPFENESLRPMPQKFKIFVYLSSRSTTTTRHLNYQLRQIARSLETSNSRYDVQIRHGKLTIRNYRSVSEEIGKTCNNSDNDTNIPEEPVGILDRELFDERADFVIARCDYVRPAINENAISVTMPVFFNNNIEESRIKDDVEILTNRCSLELFSLCASVLSGVKKWNTGFKKLKKLDPPANLKTKKESDSKSKESLSVLPGKPPRGDQGQSRRSRVVRFSHMDKDSEQLSLRKRTDSLDSILRRARENYQKEGKPDIKKRGSSLPPIAPPKPQESLFIPIDPMDLDLPNMPKGKKPVFRGGELLPKSRFRSISDEYVNLYHLPKIVPDEFVLP